MRNIRVLRLSKADLMRFFAIDSVLALINIGNNFTIPLEDPRIFISLLDGPL